MLLGLVLAAAMSSASCTYTRTYADLVLDEEIAESGFTALNLIQHTVTPGSIVVQQGDTVSIACDWPSVLATPPVTSVKTMPEDRFHAKSLRIFARDQALARTLASIYDVEEIEVGPLIKTTLEPDTLAGAYRAVSPRCIEQLSASRGTEKPVVFADGTMTVDVVYVLSARTPELADVLEPMLPDWVSAFGDFSYDPDTGRLSGRLVKAYRASSDDVYALLLPDKAPQAPQLALREPLTGIWLIDRWQSPARGVSETSGTLTVGSQKENGQFDGVFTFFLEGRQKVIEEVVIDVQEDRVSMKGTVIEGREIWTDDTFKLAFEGPNVLRGTVTGSGDSRPTRVTLIKSTGK